MAKQSFYDLLGIAPNLSTSEILKAVMRAMAQNPRKAGEYAQALRAFKDVAKRLEHDLFVFTSGDADEGLEGLARLARQALNREHPVELPPLSIALVGTDVFEPEVYADVAAGIPQTLDDVDWPAEDFTAQLPLPYYR